MKSVKSTNQPVHPTQSIAPFGRLARVIAGLMLLTAVGCHHASKKKVCVVESNCVGYPASGTAGFYATCWSSWREGPVACIPEWTPHPIAGEVITAPHPEPVTEEGTSTFEAPGPYYDLKPLPTVTDDDMKATDDAEIPALDNADESSEGQSDEEGDDPIEQDGLNEEAANGSNENLLSERRHLFSRP